MFTGLTNLAVVETMPDLWWLVLSRGQIMENLELLRTMKVFVGENGTEAALPGGLGWSNKYERVEKVREKPSSP